MERDRIIGIEPNQINHIYLQAKKSNDIEKVYIRYNDGEIEVIKRGLKTRNQFIKEINELLKSAGASKVPGRDYEVAKNDGDKAEMFAKLEENYKKQEKAKKSEYNFDIPEELAVANLRVAEPETFEDKEIKIDEETKESNRGKIVLATAIIGLAIAIGSCSFVGKNKNASEDASEEVSITTEVTNEEEIGRAHV